MTAQVVLAGATLLILYTVTVLGGAVWLQNQLKNLREDILKDFNTKHDANVKTVHALETLVLRHDIILSPEFSGHLNGKHHG